MTGDKANELAQSLKTGDKVQISAELKIGSSTDPIKVHNSSMYRYVYNGIYSAPPKKEDAETINPTTNLGMTQDKSKVIIFCVDGRTDNDRGLDFYEAEGEAAFYGPKLDVQIKSALGHDVTISTCQLDFLLPERFKLTYIGEDGKEHRPVVIHRAILGSSDRFMAFLIEETKGALPLWLAPTQAKILPISDAQLEYAREIEKEYRKAGIRIEVDDRNEKIGYKIREAQLQKIPYMLVVGDKEIEANAVAVRSRKEGDLGQVNKEEFLERMQEEIENKVR